jgi:hypothetical protein
MSCLVAPFQAALDPVHPPICRMLSRSKPLTLSDHTSRSLRGLGPSTMGSFWQLTASEAKIDMLLQT